MTSRGRERAVRLGLPALIIAGLTLVALWRVSAPLPPQTPGAPAGQKPPPRPPLTTLAEVLAPGASGRRASLENVPVREVPSARTLWIGDAERVFVVLDPDVKRSHEARVLEGSRVTLIGLVRPSPPADVAVRQWNLDPATAQIVEQGGTYLYVTEVRPAS